MRTYRIILFLLVLSPSLIRAQDTLSFFQNSPELNRSRLRGVVITEAVGYTGTMLALNQLWYADYPRTSFQFFNDNDEWLQMDKLGHAATAYYVGYAGQGAMLWGGMPRRKALWYGGSLGLVFLTSVEVFDGFSEEWGASSGDLLANTAGFGLLVGQEYLWEEQRIKMKFSAHLSDYAPLRPNALGRGWNERLLKDYNGQSYWLSANVSSFLPEQSRFPDWLNIAVGYSGDAMLSGSPDHVFSPEQSHLASYQRARQYYLSLDIDFAKLRKKPGFLRTLLQTFGYIKVPAPALEWHGQDGLKFHWLYF